MDQITTQRKICKLYILFIILILTFPNISGLIDNNISNNAMNVTIKVIATKKPNSGGDVT